MAALEQRLFGPVITPHGVTFRLWAPSLSTAPSLLFPDRQPLPMLEIGDGFFELTKSDASSGQLYMFEIAGQSVPDPGSRLQAEDAVGWSVVYDPASIKPKHDRMRPQWEAAVICELHAGTVTPEGTFAALEAKLPYFAEAGYTVLELMPVADFTGQRGWGYDGVLPFAPDRAYGSGDDLKRLIDTAHELGVGIMLDVVYNHFGPSGNYLHLYAEKFFSDKEATPWGSAINLDNPIVRSFFVENACMWVQDYGFDGLRFDAVHAFMAGGGDRLLTEIAEAVRRIDPEAYLVLENDDNAAQWLKRSDNLAPRLYSAQWNDDYHHVFHVLASGETDGYYRDYAGDPIAAVGRSLSEGFVHQGDPSLHRDGQLRGEISRDLHPSAFVSFVQNHDQIGNRAFGDRLSSLASKPANAFLRFVLLLSPQIPMLFMGEEFGSISPFLYFCDFEGELGEAVRTGRRKEFAAFAKFSEGHGGEIPDPLSLETFQLSKLDWAALNVPASQHQLERFRVLTALRKKEIVPLLESGFKGAKTTRSGTALSCRWVFDNGDYTLALNPADTAASLSIDSLDTPTASEGSIDVQGSQIRLGPWTAAFWRHY